LNTYVYMLREWASKDTLEKIERALTPPATWRDVLTGLPAAALTDESDDWAMWEAAMR